MSLSLARRGTHQPAMPSMIGHVVLGVAALVFFAATAFLSAPAFADDEAIVVEGNKRVDASTVRSYFKTGANGRYDEAARDAGLKALIETRLFDQVSVDRRGEKLVVHVHEAPVLGKVAFEGNKRIKDTELSPAIESRPRGPLQRAVVQSDAEKIVEAYKHLGRDDVSVKPVTIDRGNDTVDLVFEVTEGAKTPVRQISFVGNSAFGNRQLRAVIKTSQTNMLSFITGGDVYDPDVVNNDRELIRNYYRSKGYADANVPSAKAEYDPATKGFTLTYSIEEGPVYRFSDISVDSHVQGVDPDKLRRLLTVQSGATFDGSALDRNNEKIPSRG
jgi:outer membrane protein insertion porin family